MVSGLIVLEVCVWVCRWRGRKKRTRSKLGAQQLWVCACVCFSVCLYWKIIMFNKMWTAEKSFHEKNIKYLHLNWEIQPLVFFLAWCARLFAGMQFIYMETVLQFFLFLSRINLLKWKSKDISSGIYRALEQSTMSNLWIKYVRIMLKCAARPHGWVRSSMGRSFGKVLLDDVMIIFSIRPFCDTFEGDSIGCICAHERYNTIALVHPLFSV